MEESYLPWIKAHTEISDGDVVFTTSRGVRLTCLPIAAQLFELQRRISETVDWPEEPTRIFEDVAGSQVTIPLTEEYINSSEAADEERETWEEYQVALEAAQAEYDQKTGEPRLRLIAVKGIRFTDEKQEKIWKEDWAYIGGAPLPKDERELRLFWLQNEALGDVSRDVMGIMYGILLASGWDEEVLSQTEELFRPEMGRTEGASTEGDSQDAGEEKE